MRQIKEKAGKVYVDGVAIGGFIDTLQNKKCAECQSLRIYHGDYDAYFCPQCNVWLEKKCSDPKCQFCVIRPEKPLP